MKYQKKQVIVDAVQWNKHGDHPEVEVCTYDGYCSECGASFSEHGGMDNGAGYVTICPNKGMWVIKEDGVLDLCSKAYLDNEFEPVKYKIKPGGSNDLLAMAASGKGNLEPVLFPDDPELDAVTRMWHYYQEKYKILWPNHPERMKAAKVYEKYQGFTASKHGKGCRSRGECARHGAWAPGMAAACDSCNEQT